MKRGRLYRAVWMSLGGVVLIAAGFHVVANVMLNRFVRPKVEQAFSARLPGSSLRLGALRYDFWSNRLRCESLNFTVLGGPSGKTGSVSMTGVQWTGLLADKRSPERLLRHAELEVNDLSAGSAAGEYGAQCAHVRVSVLNSEISVRAITLQPSMSDEAFFAAETFRRIRYRLTVESCTVRGVEFAALFNGQAYRAGSIDVTAPKFESLVDRGKPRRPLIDSPPTPQEVLAAIKQPVHIDRFSITDGSIRIAGRRSAGAEPGVLTFTSVGMTANEVANPAGGGRAIGILAEGKLMEAAVMTVQMSIPVEPVGLAFHYSGKLGAMDLTRLNEYLSGTGGFEIKAGHTSGAAFEVDVVDGHAHGVLKGAYQDLRVTVLDRETGSEKGVTNRVATIVANQLKVRHENMPDKAGVMKEGKIDYARPPEDTFLQFTWNALRSGIADLLTL